METQPSLTPPAYDPAAFGLKTWTELLADTALWERLAASPKNLLLDYDGTLAPFVDQGKRALPYPEVPELVRQLMARPDIRVVLVSGRPTELVASLLGVDPPPEIWGCHGAERMDKAGNVTTVPREPEVEAAITHALQEAESWAETRRYSGHLEYKPGCLALHVRGLPKQKGEFMLDDAVKGWKSIADGSPLALHTFDGGLELRPRGVDKGHAVAAIHAESSPEHVTIYLGDDLTDEDAFKVLRPDDLPILVRPIPRASAAPWWLQPPGDLLAFFQTLLDRSAPL